MKYILFLPLLGAFACRPKATNENSIADTVKNQRIKVDSSAVQEAAAKTWLIKVIENNFNNINESEKNKDAIYSKKYLRYKTDAIGVDMDGGMTLDEFKIKWGKEFDCKYAGVSTGFLISGQDYSKINVSSCRLSSKSDANNFVFETIISDIDAKFDYKRDIKISSSGGHFLIEDVLEYN